MSQPLPHSPDEDREAATEPRGGSRSTIQTMALVAILLGVAAVVAFVVGRAALRQVNPTAREAAAPSAESAFQGSAHQLYDASLAPPLAGQVHEVNLNVEEKVIEVAKGKWMKVWTFGGTVPGPVIRVTQGDLVKFTLTNKGEISHSIDFHSAKIAPNRAYRTIQPGESITFEFQAIHPGVFMYHCATQPVLHHIGNGMYGMMIVEPKGVQRAPAREFAVVQSDLYFARQGKEGSLAKMQEKAPDWIVFNGYANQYLDKPIQVNPGEKIRMYVLNAGPSIWSAFHVIGTIFDSVWQEGVTGSSSQTINLAPSQGAVVEFSMDEEGIYPFVTHAFGDAVKGAIGAFRVGNPKTESAGTDHAMSEAPTGTVKVEAKDIAFAPSEISAKAGTVKFQLVNSGLLPHDLTIAGKGKIVVAKGETKAAEFKLSKGTYAFYCSVAGHREAGMVGKLIVE